jgi:hypothetical protein
MRKDPNQNHHALEMRTVRFDRASIRLSAISASHIPMCSGSAPANVRTRAANKQFGSKAHHKTPLARSVSVRSRLSLLETHDERTEQGGRGN